MWKQRREQEPLGGKAAEEVLHVRGGWASPGAPVSLGSRLWRGAGQAGCSGLCAAEAWGRRRHSLSVGKGRAASWWSASEAGRKRTEAGRDACSRGEAGQEGALAPSGGWAFLAGARLGQGWLLIISPSAVQDQGQGDGALALWGWVTEAGLDEGLVGGRGGLLEQMWRSWATGKGSGSYMEGNLRVQG